MKQTSLNIRKVKTIGAFICIGFIFIQSFQAYVFSTNVSPANVAEELMQGATAAHKWRSFLLLLSHMSIIYTFSYIVISEIRKNIFLYSLALIGLLIFCSLEIGIRSVEYFYFQLKAPIEYLNTQSQLEKYAVLERFSTFKSIQISLYFPLLLSQAISSIIIFINFPAVPRINLLIKIAFGLNAFRLIGRIASMHFNLSWFDSLNGDLYLPMIIIIYGLLTYWFLFSKE